MRNVVNISVLFFLLLVFCVSCETQLKKYVKSKAESRKELEKQFSEAVQGIPLVTPLIGESSPCLFLMPVSNDDDSLRVDRLYLVDTTGEKFDFERDIYEIKHIERIDETENSSCKYIAVVSNIQDKTQHEYEIDGFMYNQIWKINNGKWDYPSAIKIPVVYNE